MPEHGHGHEEGWEPSGPGTVLVDIDGTAGALVVRLPPEAVGREIEAEPAAAAAEGPFVHTAVRERPLPSGVVHAAFFPSLAPGEYRLRLRGPGGGILGEVAVAGGSVTEVALALA